MKRTLFGFSVTVLAGAVFCIFTLAEGVLAGFDLRSLSEVEESIRIPLYEGHGTRRAEIAPGIREDWFAEAHLASFPHRELREIDCASNPPVVRRNLLVAFGEPKDGDRLEVFSTQQGDRSFTGRMLPRNSDDIPATKVMRAGTRILDPTHCVTPSMAGMVRDLSKLAGAPASDVERHLRALGGEDGQIKIGETLFAVSTAPDALGWVKRATLKYSGTDGRDVVLKFEGLVKMFSGSGGNPLVLLESATENRDSSTNVIAQYTYSDRRSNRPDVVVFVGRWSGPSERYLLQIDVIPNSPVRG
jgi:hypothetical protein